MLRNRIIYFALIAAAVVFFILTDNNTTLLLLGGLILVPVLLILMELLALRGFRPEMELPLQTRIGKGTQARIILRRKSALPLGRILLRVDRANRLYGIQSGEVWQIEPADGRENGYRASFVPDHCGLTALTVSRADCFDLLGLVKFKRKTDIRREIVVYPRETAIAVDTETETSAFSGELYDAYRRGADVSEISSLRGYQSGDPQNSIHWKLSGKTGNLVVKEFSDPLDHRTLLLFDLKRDFISGKMVWHSSDDVLALVAAQSAALCRKGIRHDAARLAGADLFLLHVDSEQACEKMLLSFLCTPVPALRREITAAQILEKQQDGRFTKILYITSDFEEATAEALARTAVLTILQPVRENPGILGQEVPGTEEKENYTVVRVKTT